MYSGLSPSLSELEIMAEMELKEGITITEARNGESGLRHWPSTRLEAQAKRKEVPLPR
jgi:hypothetical protein